MRLRVQSSWVYKGHLALGKVFAAGPYKRLMVRDAGVGARAGVRAPPKNPEESSDFSA